MSDHAVAALQRIRDFVETIVYEAEGIDDELRNSASTVLLDAARLLSRVVTEFEEHA